MLTDPKLRSSLGLMGNDENAIKQELIDPLETTGNGNHHHNHHHHHHHHHHSHHHHPDERLRLDAKALPHTGELPGEPLNGLAGAASCPRTGALLYATQPTPVQNKQPLQGFDQIWGPSRSDMNQRLHTSVGGMSHYWPPYDGQPNACPTPTTPGDPPPDGAGADGQIYTLTVLHESPEHGIVWSDSNALESPVPLAPDIAEPNASYEPTVDCFHFDSTNYDLADYYAAKPAVQPHHQQQQPSQQQTNVPLMGSSSSSSSSAPSLGGHLSHQPATAISLHSTVEGLLNEIQLSSFGDRNSIVTGTAEMALQTSGHSLYNEPSSYLYDAFSVTDSSSATHHHPALLPSLAESSNAMTPPTPTGDGKLDTNNNNSSGGGSCPLAELNPLPSNQSSSSSSSSSSRSSSSDSTATGGGGGGGGGGGSGGGGGGQKRGRSLHYCSICSKAFKDKYSVNVHVRVHTGEKPFSCYLCGKSFRQKAHLEKHYQTHLHQKNLTKRPKPLKVKQEPQQQQQQQQQPIHQPQQPQLQQHQLLEQHLHQDPDPGLLLASGKLIGNC